jgi:peptide/nickel transport system substrate-binding protein
MAYPVPADTPLEDQGLDPLPATGPYMIDEATPTGIELVRNPRFEEWSGAAQPDGFVDAISVRFGVPSDDAFQQLMDGAIDVLYDPSRDALASFRVEHPGQVVQWPGPFTQFVGFDVRQPPFDDVRVRRAVSFALDRQRFVEIQGDTSTHRLTCQIVPPNFQGYLPYCPYTSAPENGSWTAPDMARAEALMRGSGAAGTPVTVLAPADIEDIAVEEYLVEVLDDLGLEAELRQVPLDEYLDALFGTPPGSAGHPQAFVNGWISDYPAAGSMIEPQFACDGFVNVSGWCDEGLDRRMREARSLYTTSPGESNRAWAAIDRELVDLAVQAPITNPVTTHAVSDRTGNVQVNPHWGLLLSRLWVR